MIARVAILGLALCASSAAASQVAPPAPTGAVAATLRDMAFVAGHWVDGADTSRSEEVWTEPAGDSMLGMWRLVADGRARVMELLAFKEEQGSVVLRLRHFDPALVAWEEKATPLVLRLVRLAPQDARFEGPTADGKGAIALTYRRPTPDALEVTLERGGTTERFSFRRKTVGSGLYF
jgi:hypothetical protein